MAVKTVVVNSIEYKSDLFYELLGKLGGIKAVHEKLKTSLLAGERHYLENIVIVHNSFEVSEFLDAFN